MTKDEKAEKLIDMVANNLGCNEECESLSDCKLEFILNASDEEGVRQCRLQLLKWWRSE